MSSLVTTLRRPGMTLSAAAATDTGKVRRLNEDAFLVAPGLVAVADGMGGHQAGEVASRLTVEALAEKAGGVPLPFADLDRLVTEANDRVRRHADGHDRRGMGTTVVGAVLTDNGGDDALVVFNVGDSRCYALVDGEPLVQLTTDHSVVQELIDRGEIAPHEARTHPERNVVTRAVGIDDIVVADWYVAPVGARSRFLFCSDGVSNELDAAALGALLGAPLSADLVAQSLIAAVLAGTASDNATVVVLDVERVAAADVPAAGADADVTGPRPVAAAMALPPPGGPVDIVDAPTLEVPILEVPAVEAPLAGAPAAGAAEIIDDVPA